ncbi:MAG: menaquinone-dependent protoporphyrinogen IX dehydrogenase [Rubrivivax sp.]|nr:menaquinone-dependent protoporphyrinogen IX dehydrogenase [Rubrivivax sp.]
MAGILILYSTVDGHTRQICERLRVVIEATGQSAVVKPVAQATAQDLAQCAAVVMGAAIRYGKHKPEVTAFIARHQAALEARPNAFFSVNVVARKPEKNRPETNPYLQKFLRSIRWKPQMLAVFAGRLDYPSYGFVDRNMIRLIMWMTKGPTAPDSVVEFTDWAQVEAFGAAVARMPAAH